MKKALPIGVETLSDKALLCFIYLFDYPGVEQAVFILSKFLLQGGSTLKDKGSALIVGGEIFLASLGILTVGNKAILAVLDRIA